MNKLKEISTYIIIIIVVVLIRTFIVTPVRVNGSSMMPTLYDKEILLLTKSNKNIKRFDIIVLKYDDERLVKRVIGLPGEHVKYVSNKLFVNNNLVDESFYTPPMPNFDIKSLGYNVIPPNHYLVLGDNRGASKDSRFFGPISIDDIIGKTPVRLYPFNKVGKIK